MSIAKIKTIIKKFDNFLVSAHINPEGDSIGSQIALYYLLKKLNKKVVILNESSVPKNLRFIKGSERILKKKPKNFKYDAFIILDCPDIHRIGDVREYLIKEKPIINIDHHVSNVKFGKVNWVDPKASSTGEMLFDLFKSFKVKIEEKEALAMYVAIMTDTGSFRYESTSSKTHSIVNVLLEKGVKAYDVYTKLHENKNVSDIKLLGSVLENLNIDSSGKIAYIWVTKKMLKDTKGSLEESDNFIGFARSIKGVEVAILFRETGTKDKIKISFRSKGKVDVNKLASFFNGGGHKKASGAVLYGSMRDVEKRVLDKAKSML